MNGDEIYSQNSHTPHSFRDDEDEDEDEEEEEMHVSDDETVGNLGVSIAESSQALHASFRSRSTIL